MANLLKAIGEGMWDSIESPWKVVEHTAKGEFSDAWEDLKHIPGNQERANSEIFNAAGIRGWVGDHPGETVGSAIGAVLGGTALAGAMGGGASGAAGGSAGASSGGGSLFSLGDVGGYFKPSTAFGGGSGGSGFQGMGSTPSFDISQGAGWQPNSTGIGELMENGGAYKASTEFGGAEAAKGTDWQAIARMLQSVKPNKEENRISTSGGRAGGGFRFDRNQYENKLLTREYESLYNQPLYNKLG